MPPNPRTHAPDVLAGRPVRGDAAPGETAAGPGEMKQQSQARRENRARGTGASRIENWGERTRRRATSPTTGRLGLIDYTLLALIALSVAITVAMAIVRP